jgi:hypothetical protein
VLEKVVDVSRKEAEVKQQLSLGHGIIDILKLQPRSKAPTEAR